MRWEALIWLLLQMAIGLTLSANITRPSSSGNRDSFANMNCDWKNCAKFSATCHTTECCKCTCDTGRTYVTRNSTCVPENDIAKDCSFMAQVSESAPWSLVQITLTSLKDLTSGLRIFHCTKLGCYKAEDCRILSQEYENNGWKELISSNSSKLALKSNLLAASGEECYNRRYQGLLLLLNLHCSVEMQSSTSVKAESCMVMKVAGTYTIGTTPDLSPQRCQEDITSQIKATSSSSFPGYTYSSWGGASIRVPRTSTVLHGPFKLSSTDAMATESIRVATATSKIQGSPPVNLSISWKILRTFSPDNLATFTSQINTAPTQSSNVLHTKISNSRDATTSADADQTKYLIVSSVIAGTAFFCIVVLVLTLLILRRKKSKIRDAHRKAMAQHISVDQYILKNKGFGFDLGMPSHPPPLPPIVKLGSFEPAQRAHGRKQERISLTDIWKMSDETDDEYDIPADPPEIHRSFSALYAKVDKRHKIQARKDEGSCASMESESSEKTKDSIIHLNIYDEPEMTDGEREASARDISDSEFEKYLNFSRKY